ncbi:MAG: FAD-linked oxidase C-terminal domain-containing protein [Vulcanimicrobiota bacterium]
MKKSALEDKLGALQSALASDFRGELLTDEFSRALYATDASIYQQQPLLVALPREPEDLEVLVKACRQCEVPLTARGGGTSLAGQTVGLGVAVDTSKYLNRVLRVVPEEGWAEVEPGLVLNDLNEQLKGHGSMFAPDPATAEHACVGGIVANNSSGTRSIRYGKTVDHVEGITFLCGEGDLHNFRTLDRDALERSTQAHTRTGELLRGLVSLTRSNAELIASRYPKLLRRVTGYNLDEMLRGLVAVGHELPEFQGLRAPAAPPIRGFNPASMLVGSEGTLGLITRARLRMTPIPRFTGLVVSHYHSLKEALLGNSLLLTTEPSASELLDRMVLNLAQQQLSISRTMGFLQGEPDSVVITEYTAESLPELEQKLESVQKLLAKESPSYAHPSFTDGTLKTQIWQVRKAGLPLLLGLAGDRKPIAFIEDTAVDPSRLVEYVDRFDQLVRSHNTTAAYYAHASVGCLHIRPLLDLKNEADIQTMARLSEEISDLVMEFEGSMSGEHGDGLARGLWNKKQFGEVLYEVFRELKRLFDPAGIMNPGKIVDSPPMTESLRYGAEYRTLALETELDWSAEGGFHTAVELCNGAGVCRKTNRGTMCPSFMVTREEEHSTRGRANLLRNVLSGRLPHESLHGKRLYEALDLCLECKACKAECPSGVDVGKMKFEFLSQYYRHNRVPLRTQLFARADLVSRFGSALAPVSNWVLNSPLKPIINHILGVASERSFPTFARQNFWDWWKRRHTPKPEPNQPRVALFVDTFNGYNEPWVAQSAVRILERLGYAVTIADRNCCGRPMMSKGLSDLAKKHAADNINRLRRFLADEVPIIGLEPSCILSFRDDYFSLVDDPDLPALAKLCVTLEEFLQDKKLPLKEGAPPLLLHGHCHQKALVGTGPAMSVLSQLPGVDLQEVDSGCCGMAGSFGYEKEHYQISKAMAYRRLIPAAESTHRQGGRVIAAGVSCRQQVRSFTNRVALHPAEILAAHLKS